MIQARKTSPLSRGFVRHERVDVYVNKKDERKEATVVLPLTTAQVSLFFDYADEEVVISWDDLQEH